MPDTVALQVASPDDLEAGRALLDQARWRFLCEGDSWFTLGSLNPLKSANLLQHLGFSQTCWAINCGYPGDVLSHMVDRVNDPKFTSLLVGRPMKRKRAWDALLVSGGGNDLIDALAVPPEGVAANDLSLRLLRTEAEWLDAAEGVRRYASEAGWQRFASYLDANMKLLVALRDDPASESKGVPIFMHTYAVPTPSDVGAGLGAGPWLLPSLRRYAIPEDDWSPLAEHFLRRLAAALEASAAALPNVHVFNSLDGLDIVAAVRGGSGGDWSNEIHLLPSGCAKLGAAWSKRIELAMG
jgi:hypothetical protein